jgi:hypothetical protein
VLSGEPGRTISTGGFVSSAREMMALLTDYLGTGYAFGIGRLREAFPAPRKKGERKVHILLVSDNDIFSMLRNPHDRRDKKEAAADEGWAIASESLEHAAGGGTCVLHMQAKYADKDVARLEAQGWKVQLLFEWEDIIAFAREFSRRRFETRRGRSHGIRA